MTRIFTEIPRLGVDHPKFPEFIARLKEECRPPYYPIVEMSDSSGQPSIIVSKRHDYIFFRSTQGDKQERRDMYANIICKNYFPVELGVMKVREESLAIAMTYETRGIFARTTFDVETEIPKGYTVDWASSQNSLERIAGVILVDLLTR